MYHSRYEEIEPIRKEAVDNRFLRKRAINPPKMQPDASNSLIWNGMEHKTTSEFTWSITITAIPKEVTAESVEIIYSKLFIIHTSSFSWYC